MDFDSFCQICHEKSAAYQCPKCQIRYCSLNCYRNRCHEPCSKKFDEREILDSFDIDNASENDERTTSNNYVRERIAEIFKRKLDEKELHNENDDENIDEMFEHLLPSKEIQGEGEGEEVSMGSHVFCLYYDLVFFSSSMAKNESLVMRNHYQMTLTKLKKMSIDCGTV